MAVDLYVKYGLKTMIEFLNHLRCPVSGMSLELNDEGSLQTSQGEHVYPVVFGIPDFRLFEPPYMTRKEEYLIAERLIKEGEHLSYDELIVYLEKELLFPDSAQKSEKNIVHRSSLRYRAPNRAQELADRVGGLDLPARSRVLDLGCGSGEAVPALLEFGAKEIFGVDISLIELILAKKLYQEMGYAVSLVLGCAEALPFQEEMFDMVYSPDVIEHVSDQSAYLSESNRVLNEGGVLLFNSPNRFSVVCPEPHVGVWFITFLPRPLVDPVCRLLGKGPYIGKRLVSLVELKRLVSANFSAYRIVGRESNSKATGMLGKIYHAMSPLSVGLFSHIVDQHVVLAQKVDHSLA